MTLTLEYTISVQILNGDKIVNSQICTNTAEVDKPKIISITVPADKIDPDFYEYDIGDTEGLSHVYFSTSSPVKVGINNDPFLPIDDVAYITSSELLGMLQGDVTLSFENTSLMQDAIVNLILA